MGVQFEFNWYIVDKRSSSELEKLSIGETVTFEKKDQRIYPVGTPLFLLNSTWEVFGFAEVVSYSQNSANTLVTYKVKSLFSGETRKTFTEEIKKVHNKSI